MPSHLAAPASQRSGAGVHRRRCRRPSGSERGAPAATGGFREETPAASRGGRSGQTTITATAAPEEVPVMPRFDALAGRFRSRRRWQRPGAGEEPALPGSGRPRPRREDGGDGEGSSGVPSSRSAWDDSSLSDGDWSGGGGGDSSGSESQAGFGVDRSALTRIPPEETTAGSSMSGRREEKGGGEGESGGGGFDALVEEPGGGDALTEDAAEEHGLLSRLRSVAQEARLEVMDSRLQDLHVSQA